MAKPSKRTPENAERVCNALKLGNTRRCASALAGLSEDTLARWIRGEAAFAEMVRRAEAEGEQANVVTIRKAATEREVVKTRTKTLPGGVVIVEETRYKEYDWKAAAWLLSRRWPDDWKERREVDLSGLTNEELLAALSEGPPEDEDEPASPR